ncbi:MAG TPA: TlpA disulfide reductase family protein [Allosphingosinicella sp.]|nr:TlpA disulfide reductase family protein [Allosphingosinicella sp.]
MRLSITLLPGLVLGLILAGCDRQKADGPQGEVPGAVVADPSNNVAAASYPTGRLDRSHAGTPAPDVTFEDPSGRPARMADFRGRPVLVNLWATWCAPCVVEMPSLEALAAREGDSLVVLALSQDFGGRQKVTDFFQRHRFVELEAYLDGNMAFMTALRIDTLPTTILYNAEGEEVWRMTGLADWESDRAARLLDEAETG